MGYRRCSSCRARSGAPIRAFGLCKPEVMRIGSAREERRDVREIEDKPAAMLHDMRRSSDGRSFGLPKLGDFHGELSRSGEMITE
jgi:hypothetical protein